MEIFATGAIGSNGGELVKQLLDDGGEPCSLWSGGQTSPEKQSAGSWPDVAKVIKLPLEAGGKSRRQGVFICDATNSQQNVVDMAKPISSSNQSSRL